MGDSGHGSRGRTALRDRYGEADLAALSPEEAARFGAALDPHGRIRADLRWELLYRLEPDLYERLVAAERLHPGILDWLPPRIGACIEVGAGTGRLTRQLAPRCEHLLAVEPARPLRSILTRRLADAGIANVTVAGGFVDTIPAGTGAAEVVIACSAVTPSPPHGGERGLAEMERVCAPGGRVVIVWPTDPAWFVARGYRHRSFGPPEAMIFTTVEEALEMAAIFYPHALDAVRSGASRAVPAEVLRKGSPCDIAWKRLPR